MVAFDHGTVDHARQWRKVFAAARRQCPVLHSNSYGGYYAVTKHTDILAVLRDPDTFSSERSWDDHGGDVRLGALIPHAPVRVGFLDMDDPAHAHYRRLINGWFTRTAVARGHERVRQIATWALDRVIGQGSCEVIGDLAGPFQVVMFLDLMGISLHRWADYAYVAQQIHAELAEEDRARGLAWLREEMAAEVARQRTDPCDGLLGHIATATIAGELISLDFVADIAVMLLLGGEATTIATIAHTLNHLTRDRAARAQLLEHPEQLPTAVEEILRYYSISMGSARTVTCATELNGHRFQTGDRILLAYGSGNLDESVFADAAAFDMHRAPNPHLTFGSGPHRCIGSTLATSNTVIFIAEVLSRMPAFTVTATEPYKQIPFVNGFNSMTMTYPRNSRLEQEPGGTPVLTAARIQPSKTG